MAGQLFKYDWCKVIEVTATPYVPPGMVIAVVDGKVVGVLKNIKVDEKQCRIMERKNVF